MNPYWYGIPIVETNGLRKGMCYLTSEALYVGSRPPTEIQQIVMDGIAQAVSWFRDPLRVDIMAVLTSPVH